MTAGFQAEESSSGQAQKYAKKLDVIKNYKITFTKPCTWIGNSPLLLQYIIYLLAKLAPKSS